MKPGKRLFLACFAIPLFLSGPAIAGDFDWISDFNMMAEGDPSGFRARLGARFKIGDAEITAVLSNVECPADAYLMFRLGEMSGRPVGYVVDRYRAQRGNGWGALAKSLGIKPGSAEFHALKSGDDLYHDSGKAKGKAKDKIKGKMK